MSLFEKRFSSTRKCVVLITKTSLPNEKLLNIVKEYYYIQIDSDNSAKKIPVIDDCSYDFIFFKEANATFLSGSTQKKHLINKRIITIHNLKPPYKIVFKNSLTFFTIKLQPWVNNYFFTDLNKSGIISLESYSPKLLQFYQEVFKKETNPEIFNLADDLMLNKNFNLTKSMCFVKNICELIEEKKGIITVNELSERFDVSRQYLNRAFKKEVLYSLKYYVTAVKILNLVKYKSKHKDVVLTKICYDYGYFDQSHFIYDFKKVCGVTPSRFFNNLPEFILRH